MKQNVWQIVLKYIHQNNDVTLINLFPFHSYTDIYETDTDIYENYWNIFENVLSKVSYVLFMKYLIWVYLHKILLIKYNAKLNFLLSHCFLRNAILIYDIVYAYSAMHTDCYENWTLRVNYQIKENLNNTKKMIWFFFNVILYIYAEIVGGISSWIYKRSKKGILEWSWECCRIRSNSEAGNFAL